tara:strand:+ start:11 stop:850 length:840 start_codon:yes stop_codon:yes gene_type:complete
MLMEKSMHPIKDITAFSPYQVGALRMLIASLVLLPVAIKNIRKFKGKNIPLFIAVGLCGNFVPSFLFPIAENGLQSSLTGMLNIGVSLFIVIISFLFFKSRITWVQLVGLFFGGLGLFLIVANQISVGENSLFHAGVALFATLFYAISLSLIKFKLSHEHPLTITSLAFLCMLIPAIIACFISGAFVVVADPIVIQGLPYLITLAVIGTALAVLMFNYMVAISTPLFASSVTYMMPIVALFFGVLDGEEFHLINGLWVGLIFIGIYLMGKKPKTTLIKK